jgi:hypothetical protein
MHTDRLAAQKLLDCYKSKETEKIWIAQSSEATSAKLSTGIESYNWHKIFEANDDKKTLLEHPTRVEKFRFL